MNKNKLINTPQVSPHVNPQVGQLDVRLKGVQSWIKIQFELEKLITV